MPCATPRSIEAREAAGRCHGIRLENPRSWRSDTAMQRDHPHLGASYKIIPQKDEAFGVEVTIPEMATTTVTGFATAADAERWIARHKEAVAAGRPSRGTFRSMQKRSQ